MKKSSCFLAVMALSPAVDKRCGRVQAEKCSRGNSPLGVEADDHVEVKSSPFLFRIDLNHSWGLKGLHNLALTKPVNPVTAREITPRNLDGIRLADSADNPREGPQNRLPSIQGSGSEGLACVQ